MLVCACIYIFLRRKEFRYQLTLLLSISFLLFQALNHTNVSALESPGLPLDDLLLLLLVLALMSRRCFDVFTSAQMNIPVPMGHVLEDGHGPQTFAKNININFFFFICFLYVPRKFRTMALLSFYLVWALAVFLHLLIPSLTTK